jgi:hypothetical protein
MSSIDFANLLNHKSSIAKPVILISQALSRQESAVRKFNPLLL